HNQDAAQGGAHRSYSTLEGRVGRPSPAGSVLPPDVDLASAGDQVVDELERVVQPARVGAAALGQVGPPATPAAYGPGDLLHEPSRLDALDEIRRHCGDEVHLAVDDAPDADDAGGDGALGRDLHQAELARPLQVRAPAQLRREVADLDDAHTVAVLLAEQGQGAHPERLVEVHLHPGHLDVGLDLLVHQLL